MSRFLFLFFCFISTQTYAQRVVMNSIESESELKRPSMVASDSDDIDDPDLKNFVQRVCHAVSEENLNNYFNCFYETNEKSRKNTAMFFAENEISMNLLDFHVVSNNGEEAEIAIKYCMLINRDRATFLSFVQLKKNKSNWKIVREKICKRNFESSQQQNCASGLCGPRPMPQFQLNFPQQGKPQQANLNCPNGQCGQNRIPMGAGARFFPELDEF
jgi:hypothetical protein